VTSYWLIFPHRYANLRSTPELPKECDIAIIGSGMAGILTEYHILSQARSLSLLPLPSLVVLESRELCSGATARNGGHAKIKIATITHLTDRRLRSEMQEYVDGVIKNLKETVDDEGVECEFELRRSFDAFQDREEYEGVKSVYEEAKGDGEMWTKRTSLVPEAYLQQVTSIRGAVGAFSVECASFWPYKLCTGVLEILVERYPRRYKRPDGYSRHQPHLILKPAY
jgi:glycine/D-amino acid oxidase-like deaminating enzyme